MWPFDLGSRDLVRVGSHALELWRGGREGLVLVGRETLARRGSMYDAEVIAEPLRTLARQVEGSNVTLVLESAFVPVLLADTGGSLWNRTQVDALLRHRFGLAYGEPPLGVSSWQLRTDYRFGERFALGFAMSPSLEVVLKEVCSSIEIGFNSWLPALSWGLGRFAPAHRWLAQTGWWAWPEQDRTLLLRLEKGRPAALNAALSPDPSPEAIEQAVTLERRQLPDTGVLEPIGVASWGSHERIAGPTSRLHSFCVESSASKTVPPQATRALLGSLP